MIYPQRQLDPYEENEVKGTRMPDYSKLAKERDVYGELGWIGNFSVKNSKNNDRLHNNYREFFDGPRNYHNQFNNSTMTNSEFFRQNAPHGSVARQSLSNSGSNSRFKTFSASRKSFDKSVQQQQATAGGSMYATPFILEHDISNKYKV